MAKRIDLDAIEQIIEDMPAASDNRKEFYRTILRARKERILDEAVRRMTGR